MAFAATVLVVSAAGPSLANDNIEAYDHGTNGGNPTWFGNQSGIFVNDNITYTDLHEAIFRNLFVVSPSQTDDFEAGWTANNCGYTQPHPYWEVEVANVTGNPHCVNLSIDKGYYYEWQLLDTGGGHFVATVGGVQYESGSVNFDWTRGTVWTNSERHDRRDSLWAHFTSLQYCPSISGGACTGWSNSYQNLRCVINTSSDYILDKVSNSEIYVKQNGTDLCP